MKIKILATIALLTASITLQANEETKKWYNGIYTGLGLSFTEGMEITLPYELGKLDLLPNNALVDIYVGYELHKYLDIELNLSNAVGYIFEETYSSFGYSSITTDTYSYYTAGLTLKPKYHFNENHVVFGVLGLNLVNGTINEEYENTDGYNEKDKVGISTISYKVGLGYEYKINNKHSLLADYSYNILGDVEIEEGGETGKINNGKEGVPSVNNYNLFGISYKYTFR